MPEPRTSSPHGEETSWVRQKLTAELLSDAHFGSGSGGGGINSLIARDRRNHPVIWASHIEGVLRDAARRLKCNEGAFFGRAGGEKQRAVFTSLYSNDSPDCHIWRSTAREAYDNRAPKDDTLRVIEYVPKGTKFVGEVELPTDQFETLKRLVQEVDALGGGRSAGSGRVRLTLSDTASPSRDSGIPTGRLVLVLKNRDPLCITATATPDNLIPTLPFAPGRTVLGAIAAWLVAEGDRNTASLLTSGKISVSDALPLPDNALSKLEGLEVLPAPLSLQSEKPGIKPVNAESRALTGGEQNGSANDVPWWAQKTTPTRRLDAWSAEAERNSSGVKLKRPEDDLFVYRASAGEAWTAFRPAMRVRLRNGRPDPKDPDASLFAIEQIAENTHFLAELRGATDDLERLAGRLRPVLEGRRWLRMGRAGAPVEVAQLAWLDDAAPAATEAEMLLTLTSDLLVRDEHLRWRTELDEPSLQQLLGDDICCKRSMPASVMVHGFNGTSRLWRMPAAAIRRGSVFELSGTGIGRLADRVAKGEWLGERTHEGFGRFRLDTTLPGVTSEVEKVSSPMPIADVAEEAIAQTTQKWFEQHDPLAKPDQKDGSGQKAPSLSQWLALVSELERHDPTALTSRLLPKTAGGKSWKNQDATAVLNELNKMNADQRKLYARFFVRWLRARMRMERR